MIANEDKTPLSEDEPEAEELAHQNKVRRKLRILVAVLAGVLAILIGVLFMQQFLLKSNAEKELAGISAARGKISALNHDLVTFKGQKLENSNTDQKALAIGKKVTDPPAFIFTNGKESKNRATVDFYLDFADQRSRDALIANSGTLRSMVESGTVELRIHPLLGGRAFSMYAAEALAEVFASDTELAWDSMLVLLRESPALVSIDDSKVLAKTIASTLENVGVKVVDAESIQNGTFSSWLLSIGDDPELGGANQVRLPHILLNGSSLQLSVDELNDPERFKAAILRGIR